MKKKGTFFPGSVDRLKKEARDFKKKNKITNRSTCFYGNVCWFPNRLLGHCNRSSFIREWEHSGSISSPGSLALPSRGMSMVVTRSPPEKKRDLVGPVYHACVSHIMAGRFSFDRLFVRLPHSMGFHTCIRGRMCSLISRNVIKIILLILWISIRQTTIVRCIFMM